MKKTAIIGFGCAGYHALRAMRENGYEGEIHVYADVSHPPANPMLTTYYVAGRIPYEGMFPFGSLADLVREYPATLHMDTAVSRLDTSNRRVILSDKTKEDYDQILIATGARAVSPALGKGGGNRRFVMRTAQDAQRLKKLLDEDKVSSAVVVGASMVGIKVVELLYDRGISVILTDLAPRMFPLACMEETAQEIRLDLERRGIVTMLGSGVDKVEEYEQGIFTYLADGRVLESDLLVLCMGTRANVELVANTHIIRKEPVKVNRGIVADTHMQTTIPGIYAAGDCCEGLNIQTGTTALIGLWANAAEQGRVAGINLAGGSAAYDGSLPSNITHYFDVDFVGVGDPDIPGQRHVFHNSTGTYALTEQEGRISCINLLGSYRSSGMLRQALMKIIAGKDPEFGPDRWGLLLASGVPEEFLKLMGGLL